jgi:hypothetical protein
MESYERTCHFSASDLLVSVSPEPVTPPPRQSPPRPSPPINYMDWDKDSIIPVNPVNPSVATLDLHQPLDADGFRQIALGLLSTLRVREAETSAYQSARDAELSNLASIIRESRSNSDASVSPPVAPKGFVRNEGQAPNFFIPVQDGFVQPAYWVKLLQNGQVAGLLKDDAPDTQPHIGELFCTELIDPSNGPVQPMPAWLVELFAGAPAKFTALQEAVANTGSWELSAETQRLRNTHEAIRIKNHQMSILAREIRMAEDIAERSEQRLANAGLPEKVHGLRSLTTHRFEGRPNRRQVGRRARITTDPVTRTSTLHRD